MHTELAGIIDQLARDHQAGSGALRAWYHALVGGPLATRTAAVDALCSFLDSTGPVIGADLALVGGALVEDGVDPARLAQSLIAPIERTLAAAARVADHVESVDSSDDDEEDEGAELVCGRLLSPAALAEIGRADPDAMLAFESMEVWTRPALAAWTRAPAMLRQAQTNRRLRDALDRLAGSPDLGSLSTLLAVLFDAPFVVLVPQLSRAWRFQLSGCADTGQLMMLLSEPLSDVLTMIGGQGRASDDILALARGEGPHHIDATFSASWHLYPWQAADPASLMPRDGVFTWYAPGGCGQHSLPPDFLPASIEPIDGTRALLLFGPSFTRLMDSHRYFSNLAAGITSVAELSPAELDDWRRRIATGVARTEAS